MVVVVIMVAVSKKVIIIRDGTRYFVYDKDTCFSKKKKNRKFEYLSLLGMLVGGHNQQAIIAWKQRHKDLGLGGFLSVSLKYCTSFVLTMRPTIHVLAAGALLLSVVICGRTKIATIKLWVEIG